MTLKTHAARLNSVSNNSEYHTLLAFPNGRMDGAGRKRRPRTDRRFFYSSFTSYLGLEICLKKLTHTHTHIDTVTPTTWKLLVPNDWKSRALLFILFYYFCSLRIFFKMQLGRKICKKVWSVLGRMIAQS